MRLKVAVLISGNGSNLQALMDATKPPNYPAEIVLVLSNKADAYGLERAKKAGVPTVVISHKDFPDRETFDRTMDAELRKHGVEFLCLAGFMRILSPWFTREWAGKAINIHPSLLPAYKGTDTHKRVLEAREQKHGCTVHWVTEELDSGAIIAQSALYVMPNDTAETLQQRVHALEHALYPEALKKVVKRNPA
ncbi:MAG: phosphoribosylglycinamide formyltransferase [Alphaproteobacteria bacterium]|nr:phosphoribosylglycinamide formyltransferase [Alphaproteobacteria bacterium]